MRTLKQFYNSFFNWIASHVPPDDFNDVLILRLDELGDFVLWLDSAKEYRKLYHDKRITLLVNEKWYDLAKGLNYWDEVVGLNTVQFRINPFYRLNFLIWMRRQGFEIVICPRHSVKFTLEPPIVAISGATQKIVCEGSFPIEKQNYFTRSIHVRPYVHELLRNADFLRGLGRNDFKATFQQLPIVQMTRMSIVICPGSMRKRKQWQLSKFIKIMHNLYRHQIIVCDTKKIHNLPRHVHDMTGQTNLIQFINIINRATLVIANDSAAIHIAVALDVPSVCIGAEGIGRFLPYAHEKYRENMQNPTLVYKQNVKDITTKEVWEAIEKKIKEK